MSDIMGYKGRFTKKVVPDVAKSSRKKLDLCDSRIGFQILKGIRLYTLNT